MAVPHPVYFIYILECADGTFYIGKTWNVTRRLRQHNGEITGGARYTSMRRPVTLVYFEKYSSHLLAARREIALKKLSHTEKKKYANNEISNMKREQTD